MPTGYTADIEKGITFKQYALNCAKAFGACVTMRDDSFDTPIPEQFTPSLYHKESLAEAKCDLEKYKSMPLGKAAIHAAEEYNGEVRHKLDQIAQSKALRVKLESMLNQAKQYVPPSPDHEKFREFMIDQIVMTIEADCNESYYAKPTEKMSANEWREAMIKQCEHDIEYHQREWDKEVNRVETRNRWIAQLRESLNAL